MKPNSSTKRLRLTAVLTVCSLLSGCHKEPEVAAPVTTELPVLEVELLTVTERTWPRMVRVQGSLIADEVTVVGAKVAGRVSDVLVELGDSVDAQSVLVVLEQSEFRLQVAQKEAELSQARAAVGLKEGEPPESLDPSNSPPVREQKATWDEARARVARYKQLIGQKAVTETEIEQAIAAEQVAAARYASALNSVNERLALIGVRGVELDLARQQLADTSVTAPFNGLIQERHVAPGTFVQIGQPLMTVVRTDPLRFRGTVPERYAQQLRVGQDVTVQIQSIRGARQVKVTRISPSLDPLSRALAFEAEVSNENGELRTGLFCEADVALDPTARGLVVPQSAIVEFAGTEKLWVVVDGVARERLVDTAERRGGLVRIESGLKAGEQILLHGSEGQIARISGPDTHPREESRNAPADEDSTTALASESALEVETATDGQSSDAE